MSSIFRRSITTSCAIIALGASLAACSLREEDLPGVVAGDEGRRARVIAHPHGTRQRRHHGAAHALAG